MIEYLQWIVFIVLDIVLVKKIRSHNLRKYAGLSLLAAGLICSIWLPYWITEIQLPSTPERIPPEAAKIIQGVSVGLSVPDRTTNG